MRTAAAVLLLLLLNWTLPGAVAQSNAKFKDIVDANFKRWDANGDGKVSAQEVNALVLDPKVAGEEAAAVAAIHRYLSGGRLKKRGKRDPLTRPELLAPEGIKLKKSAADEPPFASGKVYDFREKYRHYLARIRKATREIFAGDATRLEGIHQGLGEDCYLVSVAGACVHAYPSRLKQIIRPGKNGSCEVAFANGRRVRVPRLTDAQIALGANAGDQGLWLNILEEACGQVQFNDKGSQPEDIALDTIFRGGSPSFAIRLLSGHEPATLSIKNPKNHKQLRATLKSATAGKSLMCCNTPPKGTVPLGIIAQHVYAVLHFDEKSDKVLIWDPYGRNFKPKSEPPGVDNGYPTAGGRFEVPFRDFAQIFTVLTYETAMPAKEKLGKKKQ